MGIVSKSYSDLHIHATILGWSFGAEVRIKTKTKKIGSIRSPRLGFSGSLRTFGAMSFKESIREAWQQDRVPFYLIAAAGIVLIVFTFSRHRMTTNPRSRIITVERVLDAGTLAHQTPTDSTPYKLSIDRVKVGDNFYSSKPPLYPMTMVAQAWPLSKVLGGTFRDHDRTYVRYLTLLNQVIPYLLMLLVALVLITRFTDDTWTRRFMMLALSFGSLAYGYAVTINNHTPAAIIWMVALFLLVQIYEAKQPQVHNYLLLALLCGVGVMVDFTSVFFAGLFGLAACVKNWKLSLASVGIAAVPVLFSLYLYYEMSGSIKPYYFRHGLYHYTGSAWDHPEGLDALKEHKLLYLWNTLFAHHGLFSLSPVLLLGAIGMFWKGGNVKEGLERSMLSRKFLAGLGICMVVLVGAITWKTANYGGYCVGMRWYIPFMPLLMLAGLPVVEWLGQKGWGKALCILLLLISVLPNLEILYWEAFIQGSFEKLWYTCFGLPWE